MSGPPDDDDFDPFDFEDDKECWQCGGTGWISNCFEEFACLVPDEGCEDCLRPCDICNAERPARPQQV